MIRDGLQLYGNVTPQLNGAPNPALWAQSNFTGYTLGLGGGYYPDVLGQPGQFNWNLSGYGPSKVVKDSATPYFSTLKFWLYEDEQDLTDPATLADTTQWMNSMRADPRLNGVLLGTNQQGGQLSLASLQAYMATARPDVLVFDSYPFSQPTSQAGSPTQLYAALAKYRVASVAGNDGTGHTPIPFGLWTQNWVVAQDNPVVPKGYRPSESEIRLNQFAPWAFGAKFVNALTYDDFSKMDPVVGQLLFDASGQPTPAFFAQAETNRESRNLSPALVRLNSTDARMVKGPNSNQNNGVADFNGTSDPFLKTVTPTNLGTTNGGAPGDVVLGWFRPLTADATPASPGDDTYFMVVNGLTAKDASAAATAQLVRLSFDFGTSGITELERLSRDTGLVEEVPLISDGGSLYHLDLTLPGGTGDLFKYATREPFAVPEPAGVLAFLAIAVAPMLRRRLRDPHARP